MYQTSLATRAAWIREIPRLLFGAAGSTPFQTDGLGAAGKRSLIDQGWHEDGDPSTCTGWGDLTLAQQTDLANDYADYVTRLGAADAGTLRYGA
jgi:hypothetical protein